MARSRSTEAHDKVLRAALGLFGERGIDATSMDAIAQASGVSKATIYNHWADEEARLRITPSLIAYSAIHPEFGKAWRHRVMEPPRQCLKRILRRGMESGQLPPDLDLDAAMALLLGPM